MRSIKIKVSKELTSSSPAATLFLYYLLLQASLSKPLCKPHQNTLLYSPGPPLLQQKNLPPERIPLPLFSKPAKKNLTPFQNILHFLPCFCLPQQATTRSPVRRSGSMSSLTTTMASHAPCHPSMQLVFLQKRGPPTLKKWKNSTLPVGHKMPFVSNYKNSNNKIVTTNHYT